MQTPEEVIAAVKPQQQFEGREGYLDRVQRALFDAWWGMPKDHPLYQKFLDAIDDNGRKRVDLMVDNSFRRLEKARSLTRYGPGRR